MNPPPRGLLHRELELHKLELEIQTDELQRAQEELERARDRYRELFDAAPLAFLDLDTSARVCAANRAACALVGVSSERLLGLCFTALLSLEDADRLYHLVSRLSRGASQRLGLDLLRPDGAHRRIVVEASRNRDGVFAILHDAPGHDAAAFETRQLAALGASTSTIAHEVNNLLHVVGGSLGEIERRLDDSSALASVRKGRETLGHCRELVSRLLSYGLPDAPRRREVVVDDVVARSMDMLRPMLGDTIAIETELGAPTARVACDPIELELVLINLASNAHDAMPSGGTLGVETRVLTSGREAKSLVLVVRDTGHGMTSEVASRIFDPFFTTKRDGNGLGLATSRNIVDRANGMMTVTSAPGRGTTFELVFPIVRSELRFALGTETRPRIDLSVPAVPATRTILVVEDNGTTRLAIQEHLEALGYRVIAADGYEAALAAARGRQIDLALLDYRLRAISGELLARQLREIHPDLRVLLTSGYPRQCIDTTEHFLQKPFSLDELTSSVATALS